MSEANFASNSDRLTERKEHFALPAASPAFFSVSMTADKSVFREENFAGALGLAVW
jgi:peptidoglycan biosynthesis protein MviN/MurJ (putative lipid II flippase)